MKLSEETLRRLFALDLSAEIKAEVWAIIEREVYIKNTADRERTRKYRRLGGDRIPPDLRRAVFERDKYTCQECSADGDLTCDHIIPVSKGGATEIGNLQVLCRPCNSRKRDRLYKREQRMSDDVRRCPTDKVGQVTEGNQSPTSSAVQKPNVVPVGVNAEQKSFLPPVEMTHAPSPDLSPKRKNQPTKILSKGRRESLPKKKRTETQSVAPGAGRGTRLPDDWQPSEFELAYAINQGLTRSDTKIEAEKFRNYWTSKAGKDATKLNWTRTWHNWVLEAINRRPSNRTAQRPGGWRDERSQRTYDAINQLGAFAFGGKSTGGGEDSE